MASPMEEVGEQVYATLVREVLSSQGLMAEDQLILERQLMIYHCAAKLHVLREKLMALWREESVEVPEPYGSAAARVKAQWDSWPSALKTKKVFGHSNAIKFLSMPNVPSSCSCIFLRSGGLWSFPGCKDPIAELEAKGAVLVLCMDSYVKGSVVIVNPLLQSELKVPEASEVLARQILKEPEVWRRFLKTEHDLVSPASAALVRQVLKGNQATPRKPRPPAEEETPEKEKAPKKPEEKDALAQKAYSKIVESLLRELDYFSEPFQGLQWLENKKQLLVYHHCAKLHEHKDQVLQLLAGNEAEASLPPVYVRAVEAVREEVAAMFKAPDSEGQKMKKIFSHDHVIRFHSVKNLPVTRESCVFLRERPQSSSDVLRKVPSIFRDLIRYRWQGSPLMELEHHHLALVLTVHDRLPRAFLVISPLFAKPELLEELSGKSWPEIEEALKDELPQLIRKESDVWRAFIQRHADMVSKDSLKIIQKVLKGCQPGSGLGEFSMRFAEDVDEANQARELSQMKLAESEQRWDMAAQMALADVDMRCQEAETKVKKNLSALGRAKRALRTQAIKVKAEAEAKLETLQKTHREQVAELSKDLSKTQQALTAQELLALQRGEEVQILEDSKQELLQALAQVAATFASDKKRWQTKNAVLKQHLKQTKKEQQELCAKERKAAEDTFKTMLQEAQAKFVEVQTATVDEQQKLVKEAELQRASAAQRCQQAELEKTKLQELQLAAQQKAQQLEQQRCASQAAQQAAEAQLAVQTAALQRTSHFNVELRADCAKLGAETAEAQKAAASAAEAQRKAQQQLAHCQEELKAAKDIAEKELQSAQAAGRKAEQELLAARTDLAAAQDEAARIGQSCAQLRLAAAKVTVVEQEKTKLEERLQQATGEAATAAARVGSLETKCQELFDSLRSCEAQLSNKPERLAQLQDCNLKLRGQVAESAEMQQQATLQMEKAQEQLAAESARLGTCSAALEVSEQQRRHAESLCVAAEAAQKHAEQCSQEAQSRMAEAERQSAAAEEVQSALQKLQVQAKAELQAQRAEAQRLTEQCVALSASCAAAKSALQAHQETAAKAEQAALAKQAEIDVLQSSLASVQDTNRTLRSEQLAAKAASEEALKQLEVARKGLEKAEKQRNEAEEEALRAEEAQLALQKARKEASEQLQEMQTQHGALLQQLKDLQASNEAEAAQAGEAEQAATKAKTQLQAQVAESQRLSALCALRAGHLRAATRRAEAAERRAAAAEAERKIALAASELGEAEVRRLAQAGEVSVSAAPMEADTEGDRLLGF
ncbi:unnamed protein product [Effrenium voratum]|uniref:Uncharacterized protein n=1 Tax=Effrenium voratum TaxID=2562239 RepID=A0AA36MZN8_9DINO|nr:unnamed protein product [Effrenium voratum]